MAIGEPALQSIGFEVEDLNRETGTYFVSYSEPTAASCLLAATTTNR